MVITDLKVYLSDLVDAKTFTFTVTKEVQLLRKHIPEKTWFCFARCFLASRDGV